MDDETLLRRYAREGDEAAFRTLAVRHGGLVYAACLRDLRRADLAEDAAQGVFLVLARKASRLRVRTTLVPWLLATARLVSCGVLRAERRRPTVPLDESYPASQIESDEALFAALDALGAPEREAVVLRFVQGLSLAEVGRVQGVSEDAARMRINRALKRLRVEYVPALAVPPRLGGRLASMTLPRPFLSSLMTTPLLLAPVPLAILAVVGVARSHSRPPAPTPAKAAPITLQWTPEFEKSLKTMRYGGELPKIPTLSKPFTLVYRMTITDVRTAAMREAAIAVRAKELAKEVDEDRRTQEQADAELAGLRKPGRPMIKQVTLSYDGRTFLYEEPSSGEKDDIPNVNLFDGTYSYHLLPGAKGVDSQGQRSAGTVSFFTWNMPYVGPSVPYFPLTRGKEILLLSGWDDKLVYRPFGRIETGRGGIARRIVTGRFDPPDEFLLSDPMPLNGTFVARRISVTKRAYGPEIPMQGAPQQRKEYVLVSASPEPVAAARFDPDSYLKDGDEFNVEVGKAGGRMKIDRSKGTLQQQIAARNGGGS